MDMALLLSAPASLRAPLVALALVLAPPVAAQPTPRSTIRQAEAELWARLEDRARRLGGLMLDSSEVDLRIPLEGEPEEVIGVTRLTSTSRAVATARLEPLEAIASREDRFRSGRYDLRIEDHEGNCLLVHLTVSVDTSLVRLRRTTETCQPLFMANVVRRSRRLARIPLSAGQLTDNWSVAPAVDATADVYLDSVVVVATLMLRANLRAGDNLVRVDSVTIGLALGEQSWSIVRRSAAAVVDTTLERGEMWGGQRRFTIAIDSTFALARSWPVVEVSLSVPKTEANPYGVAWTYAHGPRSFFKDVRVSQER